MIGARASPVDESGLWRVGTRESKEFCETKYKNTLKILTYTVIGLTISTVVFTN